MGDDVEQIPMDRVRVNVWLPKNMYLQIQTIADIDGRSMSGVFREAARGYVLKYAQCVQKER